MTKNGNGDSPNAAALFEAANKLRGSVESAEYKHLVLGLLFLKYISDSFEQRRAAARGRALRPGQRRATSRTRTSGAEILEDRDEYARRERVLGAGGRALGEAARRRVAAGHRQADRRRARRDRAREPGPAERAAARLRPRAAVGRADGLAGRDDRQDRLRHGSREGARHPRSHLRVLHQGVRARRGPPRRRVLHARAGRAPARRDARAARRSRARPCLRLLRPVRPVGPVHRGARRQPGQDLDLRPGAQPGDLADRADEPRDPRPLRRDQVHRGRLAARRRVPDAEGRLRDGESAVQPVGVVHAGDPRRRPLGLRHAASRERELRLDPALPLPPRARTAALGSSWRTAR